MSRTLSRWPAKASTNRSTWSGPTAFMRMNGRNVYMYEYTGKHPRKRIAWTAGLIWSSRLRRMLTQPLLRQSIWAISATLMPWIETRSTTNRACSKMPSPLSVEARINLRMPVASSSPSDT